MGDEPDEKAGIYINPSSFQPLNELRRTGIILHQMCHFYLQMPERVGKLERSGIFAATAPLTERFNAALNEAAHRLMGASFAAFKRDLETQRRIVEDVTGGFCRRLSNADQDLLMAELERAAGVSAIG
jgi:hypothetical protein